MKNKKSNYILIALVLVWGIIFFWGNNSDSEYNQTNITHNIPVKKLNSSAAKIKSDTSQLVLNYPDPFLKKEAKISISRNNSNYSNPNPLVQQANIKKITTPSVPPNIIYKGLIKGDEVNKDLGIIYLNGKTIFVKQNQIIDSSLMIETISDTCIFVKSQKLSYRYCK